MRNFYIGLIVFCGISLIPLFIISIYNHPTGDDFFYAVLAQKYGFWGAMYRYSHGYNGRFSSNALMFVSPLVFGNIIGYKLAPAITIVLFYIATIQLVNAIFHKVFGRIERLALSTTIVSFYFLNMPGIYEGLYWLSGMVNYQLAVILFMFLLSFAQKTKNTEGAFIKFLSVALFAFLISGLNELMAIVCSYTLSLFILLYWFIKRRPNKLLFAMLFGALASLAVQLSTAGNTKRLKMFSAPEDQWSNSKRFVIAIEQTGFNFIKHSLFSPLWWFTGMFFFIICLREKTYFKQKFQDVPAYTIPFTLLSIVILFFLPGYIDIAIQNDLAPLRIVNLSFLISLAGLFLTIILCVVYFPINMPNLQRNYKVLKLFFLFSLLALMIFPSNFKRATNELVTGKAYTYDSTAYARYNIMKNCPDSVCGVPAFENLPLTLRQLDRDTFIMGKFFGKKIWLTHSANMQKN